MRRLALVLVLALAGCGGADDEPRPTPAAGTPVPGGELSIAEAKESELDGPLMVKGSLLARGGEIRLCSALAESHPPQCGEPSLRVENLDLETIEGLEEAEGVTWSKGEVSLLGAVDGDVLRVSDTAQG